MIYYSLQQKTDVVTGGERTNVLPLSGVESILRSAYTVFFFLPL